MALGASGAYGTAERARHLCCRCPYAGLREGFDAVHAYLALWQR